MELKLFITCFVQAVLGSQQSQQLRRQRPEPCSTQQGIPLLSTQTDIRIGFPLNDFRACRIPDTSLFLAAVAEFSRKFLLINVSNFERYGIMSHGFRNGNGSNPRQSLQVTVRSSFCQISTGLRRKFGPMTEEVKEEYNEELHNLYSSPNKPIIKVMIPKRLI
jgi:hypothetical protein